MSLDKNAMPAHAAGEELFVAAVYDHRIFLIFERRSQIAATGP